MICVSGVRGLQTALLMVYWLSVVSGLKLSAMSLTEMLAAVTLLSERHNHLILSLVHGPTVSSSKLDDPQIAGSSVHSVVLSKGLCFMTKCTTE